MSGDAYGSVHKLGATIRFLACSNRVKTRRRVLKRRSYHTFRESDHRVKWKVSTRQVDREKIDADAVGGFCEHCNIVFEAMGCYFCFCQCQESQFFLTEEETQRSIKKRARRPTKKILYQKSVITS